jgi:tetratricopeptide (TPR) repeat protein
MMARRYDEAIAQFKQTLDLDENFLLARVFLSETYINKGMYEEAISEAEKRVMRLQGAPEGQVARQLKDFAEMRAAYRQSGAGGFHKKRLELQKRNQETGTSIRPFLMAKLHAQLGENDRAFEWLETVVEKREGDGYLNVDPALDPVRSDPRFRELLKKAGFLN